MTFSPDCGYIFALQGANARDKNKTVQQGPDGLIQGEFECGVGLVKTPLPFLIDRLGRELRFQEVLPDDVGWCGEE